VPYDPARQAIADDEHLRLLTIGYYISAGITACYSLIGLFYAAMGGIVGLAISQSAANAATETSSNQPSPQLMGWIFGVIGIGLFVVLITIAAMKFFVARCLKQRKSRTFCFVIAILSCLEIPYGTVLGIFTILVLERPSVRRLFDPAKYPPPAPPQPFNPAAIGPAVPPRV
jgi:hypothetical protein